MKEKEFIINGWRCYRNNNGDMVAYHPVGSDPEQLTFQSDEAYERWLETEKKESYESNYN